MSKGHYHYYHHHHNHYHHHHHQIIVSRQTVFTKFHVSVGFGIAWLTWSGGWFPPFVLIAGEVLFADVLLLPNGMSKVGANM